LGYGFVEGDREAAGGIVIAGQHIGDCGAPFFAGIPRFQNGGGVIVGPVDGEGAAAREDDDERFACDRESFEELLLRGGESDICAIAAKESGIAVFGFFTLELRGNTDYGDNDIGFAGGVDSFLLEIRRKPEKADGRFPGGVEVFELNGIGVARLKMDQSGECSFAMGCPIIYEQFIVEIETIAAIGASAETVVTIDGSNKYPGPARGIIFSRHTGSRRDVVPFEVNGRIDTSENGRTGEVGVGKEFGG